MVRRYSQCTRIVIWSASKCKNKTRQLIRNLIWQSMNLLGRHTHLLQKLCASNEHEHLSTLLKIPKFGGYPELLESINIIADL
jgi:hypothetical protein